MNSPLNLSPNLRLELSGFLGQIMMGSLDTPEAVAQRCDRIADLAWAEAEAEIEDPEEETIAGDKLKSVHEQVVDSLFVDKVPGT